MGRYELTLRLDDDNKKKPQSRKDRRGVRKREYREWKGKKLQMNVDKIYRKSDD